MVKTCLEWMVDIVVNNRNPLIRCATARRKFSIVSGVEKAKTLINRTPT